MFARLPLHAGRLHVEVLDAESVVVSRRKNHTDRTMKTLLMILGAGASGKSTLTRAVCGEGGEEFQASFQVVDRKTTETVSDTAKYTLFKERKAAIAGNLKNGSDAISRMEVLSQCVDHCFNHADIVIVDGVRSSQKFVDWIQEHPLKPAAIFAYFDITLEENLRRLQARRIANGKESDLSEKTHNNVLEFRKRAERVWRYARENYSRTPNTFITFNDKTSTDQAARAVWGVLKTL